MEHNNKKVAERQLEGLKTELSEMIAQDPPTPVDDCLAAIKAKKAEFALADAELIKVSLLGWCVGKRGQGGPVQVCAQVGVFVRDAAEGRLGRKQVCCIEGCGAAPLQHQRGLVASTPPVCKATAMHFFALCWHSPGFWIFACHMHCLEAVAWWCRSVDDGMRAVADHLHSAD